MLVNCLSRPAQMWSKEKTLRLIELLRNAPALWNINYPGYRDQLVKLRETKRIASEFHVNEDEIMTQITFLINVFQKEHKNMTFKNCTGARSKFSENEWYAYEHLKFLITNKNERYPKTIEVSVFFQVNFISLF